MRNGNGLITGSGRQLSVFGQPGEQGGAAPEKALEAWETKDRLHVRAIMGDYNLKAERARLRSLPRVIKSKDVPWKGGPRMFNKVLLDPKFGGPQSLYIHVKEFLPGTASQLHGHQNDALMYVLQGAGYDVQDGQQIRWAAGDLAIIQPGTVHQHFCTSAEPARVLIIKTKSIYLFMNMLFQELLVPASKEPLPGWEGYQPEP